tara:strand:- start:146 stop:496 length:351 start_codon:yes stop_codon:yes gene_type:complete
MLSNFEKAYRAFLDDELKQSRIISYTSQKAISLDIYNASQEPLHFKDYKIDFVVDTGSCVEWVEVKGFQTNDWLNKWQLAKHLFYDYIDHKKNAKLVLITGSAKSMKRDVVEHYYT